MSTLPDTHVTAALAARMLRPFSRPSFGASNHRRKGEEMPTDEYIELVKTARWSLHDLLMKTEPGTGMGLHAAYSVLKEMCKEMCKEEEPAAGASDTGDNKRPVDEDWRTAGDRWKRMSYPDRERLVIAAIGDDSVGVKQIVDKLQTDLGKYAVYREGVQAVLKRLMEASEVCRAEVPGYRGGPHPRWQYFRNTQLDGPIADLERTFNEPPA
jgi:hypothetical protein